ncbi:MAG: hypothetical protein JXX29_09270 [Deltaproteobacteria bacterium]|nr:hypothetical protein [Deltaproteobacteria bacterium]MBN2671853.1 hypothetical protein [Deltaproteobacteria bacterium]
MPNITLSMDESILKSSREYAKRHNMSLNALVRELLEQRIGAKDGKWVDGCFEALDKLEGNSNGATWRREDVYDV